MTHFVWNDSMTTGLEILDTQHKELLEKLNELVEAAEQHKGREIIGDILDFLQFYVLWHFEKEEACMEQYRCPTAQHNKAAHAEFVQVFSSLYEEWQQAGPNSHLVDKVSRELRGWLFDHINKTDVTLYPCVKHEQ